MHAASVHPEPGSNSLKNCIQQARSPSLIQSFFRAIVLASFTFLSSQCVLTRFLTHLYTSRSLSRSRFCFVFFRNSVVQFSRIHARPGQFPFRDARLVYHTLFFLSSLFFKFFQFFLRFLKNWQLDEKPPFFPPPFSGFCHPFCLFCPSQSLLLPESRAERLSFS